MMMLAEVIDEILSGSLTIGKAEATDNTWSISLTAEQVASTSAESVVSFLSQARSAYASLAVQRSSEDLLRFYAWVDEAAGQLRFSVSSSEVLPFGAAIQMVPEASDLARQFLSSRHMHGIPWSELKVDDASHWPREQSTESDRSPVSVYVVALLDGQSISREAPTPYVGGD